MKSLGEVIAVKNDLEKKLIRNPSVTVIDIGASDDAAVQTHNKEQYVIRVFVNDPGVSYNRLGIPRVYREVPVTIRYRKITLQQ